MKNVVFITREKIIGGSGAPSSRNLLFAKMFSEEGIFLHLFSFDMRSRIKSHKLLDDGHTQIYGEQPKNERFVLRRIARKYFMLLPTVLFLYRTARLIRKLKGETVIYQDWTTTKSVDIGVLFIFRFIYGYKIYTDPNEVFEYLVEAQYENNWGVIRYFNKIKQSFGDLLLRYYNGLIIISSQLEDRFSKLNKNYIRIPIISNVTNDIAKSSLSFKSGDIFKIGYFGTLQIYKEGLDLIIDAIEQLKQKGFSIEIHFYGKINKYETSKINNLIDKLNGSGIYHGLLSNEQVIQLMKNYHLLVSARRLINQTRYGFSTKLAEYMATGVPYLVTNIGDNSLYIKDGVNGYIIEPGSQQQLTEKLEYIITNYGKEAEDISRNAVVTAKKYFDYRIYKSMILEFFFKNKDNE